MRCIKLRNQTFQGSADDHTASAAAHAGIRCIRVEVQLRIILKVRFPRIIQLPHRLYLLVEDVLIREVCRACSSIRHIEVIEDIPLRAFFRRIMVLDFCNRNLVLFGFLNTLRFLVRDKVP